MSDASLRWVTRFITTADWLVGICCCRIGGGAEFMVLPTGWKADVSAMSKEFCGVSTGMVSSRCKLDTKWEL